MIYAVENQLFFLADNKLFTTGFIYPLENGLNDGLMTSS